MANFTEDNLTRKNGFGIYCILASLWKSVKMKSENKMLELCQNTKMQSPIVVSAIGNDLLGVGKNTEGSGKTGENRDHYDHGSATIG